MASHLIVDVKVLDEVLAIERKPGVKVVGLISDTHIPSRAEKLPDKVFEVFKDADLIVHAGDITRIKVFNELEKIAPVLAVHGNMDPYEVKAKLPEMDVVEFYGWRIGVVHDPGALWGMGEMRRIAEEKRLNILVFGHTHRHFVKWEGDVLFINPGSPTNPLPPILEKPTVGLLLITEEEVKPLIIRL